MMYCKKILKFMLAGICRNLSKIYQREITEKKMKDSLYKTCFMHDFLC